MDDSGAESNNLSDVLSLLKQLIESDSNGLLESDPELRKQVWQVVNYKLGVDEKDLKELCDDFEARSGNYEKMYAAIREQMKVVDQLRNKRQ